MDSLFRGKGAFQIMGSEIKLVEAVLLLILILSLCAGSAYEGYQYEAKRFNTFVDKTKLVGQQQQAIVTAKNKEIQDNAIQSAKNEETIAKSASDYYLSHPAIKYVRVFDANTGRSSVSQANSNPKIPYEANTPESTTGYFSAYSEQECEAVGSQLTELQQLLIKDGVKIE